MKGKYRKGGSKGVHNGVNENITSDNKPSLNGKSVDKTLEDIRDALEKSKSIIKENENEFIQTEKYSNICRENCQQKVNE